MSQAEKLQIRPLPGCKGLPEAEDPSFPLVLTSAKSIYYLHSAYRWLEKLRKKQPHPQTWIHPQTAGEHGIRKGDEVIVETRCGQIIQVARLTDAVHPRVIVADHGWWFPEENEKTLNGWNRSNLNMLTSTARLGREFGTPNLKGINCRIRCLSNPSGQSSRLPTP